MAKKLILLVIVFLSVAFSADDQNKTKEEAPEEQEKKFEVNLEAWNFYDFVELKKDQVAKYSLIIDNKAFDVQFRWTLFVNDGLVMLYNYAGDDGLRFKKQNVLYAKYRLDGFKIELKERATNAIYRPYIYISFKNYDKKTKKALFHVFLKDEKRSILVDRILPKDDGKQEEKK